MAKKTIKKSPKKINNKKSVKNQTFAVILFGVAVLVFCLILIRGDNIWRYFHNLLPALFGKCVILWPILFTYVAVMETLGVENKSIKLKICLSSFVIWVCSSLFYVFSLSAGYIRTNIFIYIYDQCVKGFLDSGPGLFGAILGVPFVWAFGLIASRITLLILLFISVMFLTGTTLLQFFKFFTNPIKIFKEKISDENLKLNHKNSNDNKNNKDIVSTSMVLMGNERNKGIERLKNDYESSEPSFSKNILQNKNLNISSKEAEEIAKVTEEFILRTKKESGKATSRAQEIKEEEQRFAQKLAEKEQSQKEYIYSYPPLELLNKSIRAKEDDITEELQNNGQMLVDTLKSFNVQTKIVDISRGPAVTRYEIQPASGVKISKITTLADDIALNLASAGVRIEAPIPGKAAVGVEIPNKVISLVNMNELISSKTFLSSESKLTVVLGRDISGKVVVTDLGKMPHLLIAGSTGSGKSVCVNSFIVSILYNSNPDEVKLLMIDPKVVELGVYNGIPHLLVPVVTDPKKAAGALNWAVNEMLKRYKQFAENNVRDLSSYNKLIGNSSELKNKEGEKLKKMSQIVIIIDELSDLMMAAPNEVEDYICRLAQMARAAGMHLVIATQRPSVDVITGIIKANIPSRIALAVSSQIDSRTILDMSGAEKLLGRGDMLFSPVGAQKPIRVQGCYVTDNEIEKVTKFVKNSDPNSTYDQSIVDEIEKNSIGNKNKETENSDDNLWDDVLIEEAAKLVIDAGQASTSMLQRRLRIGYARAGKLIDQMEQMGIVGPHEGSKPRQVMMTFNNFLEMKSMRN